ncbi:MAG: glycosyltransferase family 2 protein [Bacteroidales bacterium]
MANFANNHINPLVSIGVPVYNGAEYVVECLQSIVNQTYTNWECVVIDNCSTDNTNELVSEFVARDKRFRLIKNTRFLNVMQNWNESYKHISKEAKYFKVVPADDWLFENYLEENVNLLEKNPDVSICSSYRIDGKLIRGNGLNFYEGNIFDGKYILAGELIKKIDVTGSGNTVLYRIDSLKKLPDYPIIFDEFSLHVDTELAYNLLSKSKLGFIYKVLSYTRRHHDSITNSIVYKLNTSVCFRDNQLKKYADIIPDFNKYYNRYRYEYAILYTKKFFARDKKWLEWHDKHLENKFTFLKC